MECSAHLLEQADGLLDGGDAADEDGTLSVLVLEAADVVVLLIEVEHAVELFHIVVILANACDEEAAHLAAAQDDALEADLTAQLTKEDDTDEFFSGFGNLAEAVDETLTIGIDLVLAS